MTRFDDLAEWSLIEYVMRCAERSAPNDDVIDDALAALRGQVDRAGADAGFRAWVRGHAGAAWRAGA